MTRHAPAKINLTLEILGRRPDGYHDLRSVMQAISLSDILAFEPAPPGEITLTGGNADAPPTDNNLVLKAARALNAAAGGGHGARITLTKRIPVGAGLGGGSSDAATTLLALNDLWETGLSTESLSDIASGIGSDVPFFLGSGTALVEGRGERIQNLSVPPPLWIVLAKPVASLGTPDVYREYARRPEPRAPEGHGLVGLVNASRDARLAEKAFRLVAHGLVNDLQPAAIRLCPDIAGIQARLREAGAPITLVCGSGSAVFAVAADEGHARGIATAVAPIAAWTAVAHTVSLPYEGREDNT